MTKKFKLQPVLDYRQIREAQARQHLAVGLEREQYVSRRMADARDRLHSLRQDLEERQRGGINIADLVLHRAKIEGVEGRLKNLEKDLERCRRDVQECRQNLCETSRDRKLLERLKEKFAEESRKLQNRQETIVLDEIALHFGKGES